MQAKALSKNGQSIYEFTIFTIHFHKTPHDTQNDPSLINMNTHADFILSNGHHEILVKGLCLKPYISLCSG